jgi:HTH-type transcriptional regulator, competence development regulator
MTLGERIKALRKDKGFTQRQLAGRTDLDYTYLSKIENDRLEHTPSIRALQTLARELESDELELIRLADKMPNSLQELAQSKEALQFFRKASLMAKSPHDWRTLSQRLDELASKSPRSEEGTSE